MRPKAGQLGETRELEIAIDMVYRGSCHITLEADLVFGKTAVVSVTIVELSGKMRLALRHTPTPHYTLAFYEEPKLQIEVESVFEGRSVHQLSSLIANQIRRSIRKKHTMPAGRMRYAPFFQTPAAIVKMQMDVYGLALFAGIIQVKVKGAHGMESVRPGSFLFCTLSLHGEERADQALVNREVQRRTFQVHTLTHSPSPFPPPFESVALPTSPASILAEPVAPYGFSLRLVLHCCKAHPLPFFPAAYKHTLSLTLTLMHTHMHTHTPNTRTLSPYAITTTSFRMFVPFPGPCLTPPSALHAGRDSQGRHGRVHRPAA